MKTASKYRPCWLFGMLHLFVQGQLVKLYGQVGQAVNARNNVSYALLLHLDTG